MFFNAFGVISPSLSLTVSLSSLSHQEKWSALLDVRTILLSIQSLLAEPNNDSPLNSEAAELWENQAGEWPKFHKTHRLLVIIYKSR